MLERLAAFGSFAVLTGCAGLAGFAYTGDGKLHDRGMLAYSARYEIDLGEINTSVPGKRTYRLSGLPRATFTVGVEVVDSEPNRIDDEVAHKRQGLLAVSLRNSAAEQVIDERADLSKWVRSYGLGSHNSRFYRAGKSLEIPQPAGGIQHKNVGVKASGGWGTYFESDPSDAYILEVTIVEPFVPSTADTRVTLVGWDR